ncbi:MAG: CotH kinase family protein [Bacteroidia bacterium]|nr:CotH kinase family protein [Bacteroidia bacterium]
MFTFQYNNMSKIFIKGFFILIIIFSSSLNYAQTYTGTGGNIPDDGNSIDFTIMIDSLSPSTLDTVNFGIETVCLDIIHTWDQDLDIRLIAPDGTEVLLVSGAGWDGDNFTNTCFNHNAETSIITAYPPFTGTFKPVGYLGYINNGQNGNGEWKLHILDTYAWADAGELLSWSIAFGNAPAVPFVFSSSNLPIININTNGQTIPDEPKIIVDMGIIYNGTGLRNYMTDSFNHYYGKIAIEIRGSSSQMFSKKSYGFETVDSLGARMDTSLLSLPSEHDWILYGPYSDKSLLRNALTYKLSREQGHYASRTIFCELVINEKYEGVYVFMEKLKRDKNRIDISHLYPTDNSGDQLTGGYILKIDKTTGGDEGGWISSYPPLISDGGQQIYFQYEEPEGDEITTFQSEYIQAYVDSFENALAGPDFADTSVGYKKYIGINSFIDYFIINEVSRNVDGYRLSTFLYKDRHSKGGKLKLGPVWDFDLAWWNADYCRGYDYTGYAYKFGDDCPGDYWQVPFWWDRFMEDTSFTNHLKCHWIEQRMTFLDTTNLFAGIDSMAEYLNESQNRNFQVWPIWGIWVWPNPSPLANNYQEEIIHLKKWLKNRLEWLDAYLPGECNISFNIESPENIADFYISPNPNNAEYLKVHFPTLSSPENRLIISDIEGKILLNLKYEPSVSNIEKNIKLSLNPGVYIVKLETPNKNYFQKLIQVE